jgi:anti-sigma factor RsiW
MEASRIADLHAYVDDCLKPNERLAFEQQMVLDPALARRAMLWRTQNTAIRMASTAMAQKPFRSFVNRPRL